MSYVIPLEISTERLHLRKPIADDWQGLMNYYGDEVCMKHTYKRSLADWEVWRQVATMVGHWEIHHFGPYVLVEKSTGNILGPIGLWFPLGWPEPEIKWGMRQDAWGKGYAKEGAHAVHHMAAVHLPELHLISLIAQENKASIGVAKGIGAVYERTIPFRDGVAEVYRHLPAADVLKD